MYRQANSKLSRLLWNADLGFNTRGGNKDRHCATRQKDFDFVREESHITTSHMITQKCCFFNQALHVGNKWGIQILQLEKFINPIQSQNGDNGQHLLEMIWWDRRAGERGGCHQTISLPEHGSLFDFPGNQTKRISIKW